jgi:hypothetical protein
MYDIGIGLEAANTFFDSNERTRKQRIAEEREARRWKSEAEGLDAGDTARPSATEAEISGNQNTTQANRAQMEVRPYQTQVAVGELEGEIGRQPKVEQTKDLQAQTGLDQATVTGALSGVSIEQLPDAIKRARAQGAASDIEIGEIVLGGLARAVNGGDNKKILDYINRVGALDGSPQVARVGMVDGNFVALDANGQEVMKVPMTQLERLVYPRERVVLKEGETLGTASSRGDFVPTYKSAKSFAPPRAGVGGKQPAAVQTAEWLMKQSGGALTGVQAFNLVQQAKSKPRGEYVREYVRTMGAAQAVMGSKAKTVDQLKAEANDLYNETNGFETAAAAPAPAPAPAAGSNRPAPATRNSKFDALLGIKPPQ